MGLASDGTPYHARKRLCCAKHLYTRLVFSVRVERTWSALLPCHLMSFDTLNGYRTLADTAAINGPVFTQARSNESGHGERRLAANFAHNHRYNRTCFRPSLVSLRIPNCLCQLQRTLRASRFRTKKPRRTMGTLHCAGQRHYRHKYAAGCCSGEAFPSAVL